MTPAPDPQVGGNQRHDPQPRVSPTTVTRHGKCPASTTPRMGEPPTLQRSGGSHGMGLVPQTLTAGARPCPPLPRCCSSPHPVWEPVSEGIAHIPQGSRTRAFRVTPGHSVSGGAGIAHIRPICAKPPTASASYGGASTEGDARRLRPGGDLRWLEETAGVPSLVTVT